MKNLSWLRDILLLSVGAAIGSAITYKIVKEKEERRADEEIERYRELYSKRMNNTADNNEPSDEDYYEALRKLAKPDSNESPTDEEIERYTDLIKPYSTGAIIPEDSIDDSPTDQDILEDEDVERIQDDLNEINTPAEKEVVEGSPVGYKITFDEFQNERPEYDKVTIKYFPANDLLIDEDEQVIDIDSTVGFESVESFNDDGTSYARNDHLAIDYEILLIDESWEDYNGE